MSHATPRRSQPSISLEATFRDGRAIAAYLRVAGVHGGARRCVELEDVVVDLYEHGELVGIELLAPHRVTAEQIDAILARRGLGPIDRAILEPLRAA